SVMVPIGSTDSGGYFSMPLSTASYNISCGQTAYVVVNGSRSSTIAWEPKDNSCASSTTDTVSNTSLTFSKNNLVMNANQNQTINIYGTGGYSITSNPYPSVVSANIDGSAIDIHTNSLGNSNIVICESSGTCATLYISSVDGTYQTTYSQTPTLSSFSVSSNNLNGKFLSIGSVLNIVINVSSSVSRVTATVNGTSAGISGSGSGPYTIQYTVTGNETLPIPVIVNFSDGSGNYGQVAFSLGNLPVAQVVTSSSSSSSSSSSNSKYVFSSFLTIDSTGTEVTELQKRLTSLGFFSGPITGYFGPLTKAAVIKFQKAHKITQAGYVGPSTRAILNQN
ncbi:MAG: peptidoglycan-binding domain-containing protein, partial [bacterium]